MPRLGGKGSPGMDSWLPERSRAERDPSFMGSHYKGLGTEGWQNYQLELRQEPSDFPGTDSLPPALTPISMAPIELTR